MADKSTATQEQTETISAGDFCLQFNEGCRNGLTRRQIREKMGLKEGNFNSREREYRKRLEGKPMQLLQPAAAPRGGRQKLDFDEIAAALVAQDAAAKQAAK